MAFVGRALAECAYRLHFRRYCPACGGTRALEALLRLDVVQSLRCNPIVVLLAVLVALALLPRLSKRFHTAKFYLFRAFYGVATLIIWLGFALVRNALLSRGVDLLGDIL